MPAARSSHDQFTPTEPQPLDLEISRSDERTLVALTGELDAATASYLYAALAKLEVEDAHHVVLDLAKLTFMDSTGLSMVVTEHTRLKRSGEHSRSSLPHQRSGDSLKSRVWPTSSTSSRSAKRPDPPRRHPVWAGGGSGPQRTECKWARCRVQSGH